MNIYWIVKVGRKGEKDSQFFLRYEDPPTPPLYLPKLNLFDQEVRIVNNIEQLLISRHQERSHSSSFKDCKNENPEPRKRSLFKDLELKILFSPSF